MEKNPSKLRDLIIPKLAVAVHFCQIRNTYLFDLLPPMFNSQKVRMVSSHVLSTEKKKLAEERSRLVLNTTF